MRIDGRQMDNTRTDRMAQTCDKPATLSAGYQYHYNRRGGVTFGNFMRAQHTDAIQQLGLQIVVKTTPEKYRAVAGGALVVLCKRHKTPLRILHTWRSSRAELTCETCADELERLGTLFRERWEALPT